MPDLNCRIAKLEQAHDDLEDAFIHERDHNRRKMDTVSDQLSELQLLLQKQKGFVGGVVFTVGALFSFITWFITNKGTG